jgi:hypothetical protein
VNRVVVDLDEKNAKQKQQMNGSHLEQLSVLVFERKERVNHREQKQQSFD